MQSRDHEADPTVSSNSVPVETGQVQSASLSRDPTTPSSVLQRQSSRDALQSSSLPALWDGLFPLSDAGRPRGGSLVLPRLRGDGGTDQLNHLVQPNTGNHGNTEDTCSSGTFSSDDSLGRAGQLDLEDTPSDFTEEEEEEGGVAEEVRLRTVGQENEQQQNSGRPALLDGESAYDIRGMGSGGEGQSEPNRVGRDGDGVDDNSTSLTISQSSSRSDLLLEDNSLIVNTDPPSLMNEVLQMSHLDATLMQSLLDRESLTRPPIVAGQEESEGAPKGLASDPTPSVSGSTSTQEPPPNSLPSASTIRSSFLSAGKLLLTEHQRPVVLGEKDGEEVVPKDGGDTPPGDGGEMLPKSKGKWPMKYKSADDLTSAGRSSLPKLTSEGYFSDTVSPQASRELLNNTNGQDKDVVRRMKMDLQSSSTTIPEASDVVAQLALMHPTPADRCSTTSSCSSSMVEQSSDGSIEFSASQPSNPFGAGELEDVSLY